MKHVAVLMGGWSAERPVSLNSGKGCADALEARGYKVTRVDVGRDIAQVLVKSAPRRRLQRPAWQDGRGRPDAGSARAVANPLHPFRRARLGAGGSQGARQNRARRRRRAGGGGPRHRSPRGGVASRDGAALCAETGVRGIVARRRHRQGRSRPSAAGSGARGLALWRRIARRTLHRRQGADLLGVGRPGAWRHRNPPGVGSLLRIRRKVLERRLAARASRRD